MAGNINLPSSLRQPIRLIIYEIVPQVLVSDGYNFVEAIFTSECINDLKRGGYQKEFTRLKDKVIFVNQWSLQVDNADSQVDYHSFENLKIRFLIEQFSPKLHENVPKSLQNPYSIYKCSEKIQPLIKNFRHWIYQTLIYKSAWSQNSTHNYLVKQNNQNALKKNNDKSIDYFQECCDIQMPSLLEIMSKSQSVSLINNNQQNGTKQLNGEKNKGKKKINTANQSHNSQNTTQQSINDPLLNSNNILQSEDNLLEENTDNYQKFGGQIFSSEVFRYKQHDFVESDKIQDKLEDFEEYKQLISIRKKQISKDHHETDIQRTILQEYGELAYEQKSNNKKQGWLDLVQDDRIREQIKCKIDYFQIGTDNLLDNLQSTFHSKDPQAVQNIRNTRKLVGYKIERSAQLLKEKLIAIKDKYKDNEPKKKFNINLNQKGYRPRANSQENILQLKDESQCDNIMENTTKVKKREGLSQNVYQQNYDLDNETQSEKSNMDSDLEGQLKFEKQGKVQKEVNEVDQALIQCQANISIFNNYLQWMSSFKIASIGSFNRLNDEQKEVIQEKVKKPEQQVAKKRTNEHRNSRKLTKYVDDGDDFKLLKQDVEEEDVQQEEVIKEDEKMDSWSDQKEEKNKEINQLDDYQYQHNLQLESLSQSSEDKNEEMKDLEEEQIIQSSQNNQLNLIADSSSSNNIDNTVSLQNQLKTPQIKYRPPYIEPKFIDPSEIKFQFEYSIPPPQPQKPINEMTKYEKSIFDMEMEEYNDSKIMEQMRLKKQFQKQQKELLLQKLQEDELRNNEKTQMQIEDFESKKMNQLLFQEQEKKKQASQQLIQQNQMNEQVKSQNKLTLQYREMAQNDLIDNDNQDKENEESIQTVSEQSEHNQLNNNNELENRRAYANQMKQKYGRMLDKEISKCTQRDMQFRDYKSQENTDKRHDVLKVFEEQQKKNQRNNYIRQKAQQGILLQEEELDLESMKSPKFQSLEDAEKELNNKEYLKSDDKKNMENNTKQKMTKNVVEDDFPSFQENIEEADESQMMIDQTQRESPQKQDNNENEGQEDEWEEPNENQNENDYKNKDEDEAQNESYGEQKSEDYEDQNSDERADDPIPFNNQEIKQEQDVVEIETSQNDEQEESEDEVLELQGQNNNRNNKFQQQNYQKNINMGNQYNSISQRQLLQTPPQSNKINAYQNMNQSSSKKMGIPQNLENEKSLQNNQQFTKTKPLLLAQSPNRGQYIQQIDEDDVQENNDQLENYQNELKNVQIKLNQIHSEFKQNKQQNLPILKAKQQKLCQAVNYLKNQIQILNQNQQVNDPKLFKGRQNFNGEFNIQPRELNDTQIKKNFSPSKNTPHFPVSSQRSSSQMRPQQFEQQKNFNDRNLNKFDQKNQGKIHQNQFYPNQSQNNNRQRNQYQNQFEYQDDDEDCNQYDEENGPQQQPDMDDDNQLPIQEIDQEPILIEQEEEEYHVPSFGSQVKQNRDEIGSSQQRNHRNNQSSGNKRIQRSKSPENIRSAYGVQPFSVNEEEDEEDQDQQQNKMPIMDQRQKQQFQQMKPEQYFNQNVGQKRNFQQFNNSQNQNNQMMRNRSRSVSQSRPDTSSRQGNQFMNQNGYNQGYDRNQREIQRQNEINYKNLSEYADQKIQEVHKENIYSSAKSKEHIYLQNKIEQKRQTIQDLQNTLYNKKMQLEADQDQEQEPYDQNIRNDIKVKQFPKNHLQQNQFNQRAQQQNVPNRNFNEHQFNDTKGYKNVNQGEKMQQRPKQNGGITPQEIQAIQQQYSQKQFNNQRPNPQMKAPQNNFVQPRHDQVPHKNLQPLIPPQKRMVNIPQDQISDQHRLINQNNNQGYQQSSKGINSLSSKKNYVAQVIDDQDEDDKISGNYPQKKVMHEDPRKQHLIQQQKFQNIEKYQHSNGNMIGFGNKRQYGGGPNMQSQSEYGMNQQNPKKQKLINENLMNNQFQKQNAHQYQYNQFEGNQQPRMKQVGNQQIQKVIQGAIDQADVNFISDQDQQQFSGKRRRLE